MKNTHPYFDWKDYNGDIIATNTSISMNSLLRERTATLKEYEYKRKLKKRKEKESQQKN